MPYIEPRLRHAIDAATSELDRVICVEQNDNLGSLNYAITKLIHYRFKRRRRYVGIVEVTGTLICVLLEFYMRHARTYENEKIAENGDVKP